MASVATLDLMPARPGEDEHGPNGSGSVEIPASEPPTSTSSTVAHGPVSGPLAKTLDPSSLPTVFPTPVANLVTALATSARLSLRVTAFFIEAILETTQYGTRVSLGYTRRILISAVSSARTVYLASNAILDSEYLNATGMADKDALEVSSDAFFNILDRWTQLGIYVIHHTFTLAELFTMSGFYLTANTVQGASFAANESVTLFDSLFGSNESSRALASIITLVRRELLEDDRFKAADHGKVSSLKALTKALTAFACLQTATWSRTSSRMKMRVLYDCTITISDDESYTSSNTTTLHKLPSQPSVSEIQHTAQGAPKLLPSIEVRMDEGETPPPSPPPPSRSHSTVGPSSNASADLNLLMQLEDLVGESGDDVYDDPSENARRQRRLKRVREDMFEITDELEESTVVTQTFERVSSMTSLSAATSPRPRMLPTPRIRPLTTASDDLVVETLDQDNDSAMSTAETTPAQLPVEIAEADENEWVEVDPHLHPTNNQPVEDDGSMAVIPSASNGSTGPELAMAGGDSPNSEKIQLVFRTMTNKLLQRKRTVRRVQQSTGSSASPSPPPSERGDRQRPPLVPLGNEARKRDRSSSRRLEQTPDEVPITPSKGSRHWHRSSPHKDLPQASPSTERSGPLTRRRSPIKFPPKISSSKTGKNSYSNSAPTSGSNTPTQSTASYLTGETKMPTRKSTLALKEELRRVREAPSQRSISDKGKGRDDHANMPLRPFPSSPYESRTPSSSGRTSGQPSASLPPRYSHRPSQDRRNSPPGTPKAIRQMPRCPPPSPSGPSSRHPRTVSTTSTVQESVRMRQNRVRTESSAPFPPTVDTVSNLFPHEPLIKTIHRFMRYSTAAYGQNFLRIFGLGNTDFNFPTTGRHHANSWAFAQHTNIPIESLLLSSYCETSPAFGSDKSPPLVHYIAVEHNLKAIVLTCRGTLGLSDVLVDLTCDFREIDVEGGDKDKLYLVHSGMYDSAQQLTAKQSTVHQTLVDALNKYPTYGLVLCGHSLGGGVAALLALSCSVRREVFMAQNASRSRPVQHPPITTPFVTSFSSGLPPGRPIHCYGYGVPAVASSDLTKYMQGLCTSVVQNTDVVPTLSLGVLRDLKNIAVTLFEEGNVAEEIVGRVIGLNRSKFAFQNRPEASNALATQEQLSDEQILSDWMVSLIKTMRADMDNDKLYPPGMVYIMEYFDVFATVGTEDVVSGDQATSRKRAQRVILRQCDSVEERFREPLFSKTMLTDHLPSHYERSTQLLFDGLGQGLL